MKVRKWIWILFLPLLFSCRPGVDPEDYDSFQHFENDSLMHIIHSALQQTASFPMDFETTRELVDNMHVPGQVDTLKTLTFRDSYIQVYLAQGGVFFISEADIVNEEISMHGIRVGMKKANLEQALDKNLEGNAIRLTNRDQTSTLELYLEMGILRRMKYEGSMY